MALRTTSSDFPTKTSVSSQSTSETSGTFVRVVKYYIGAKQKGNNIITYIKLQSSFILILVKCRDSDGGSTDKWGDTCQSWYINRPETCGNFDDDDFTARKMCCACKSDGNMLFLLFKISHQVNHSMW